MEKEYLGCRKLSYECDAARPPSVIQRISSRDNAIRFQVERVSDTTGRIKAVVKNKMVGKQTGALFVSMFGELKIGNIITRDVEWTLFLDSKKSHRPFWMASKGHLMIALFRHSVVPPATIHTSRVLPSLPLPQGRANRWRPNDARVHHVAQFRRAPATRQSAQSNALSSRLE